MFQIVFKYVKTQISSEFVLFFTFR